MRLIDADKLRGRVCEIFLCAEPNSAEERRFAIVLGLIDSEPTITLPPNDPLTLDELRGMDGEPVWDSYLSQYGTVEVNKIRWCVHIRYLNNWIYPRSLADNRYYRRRPEEVTP